MILAFFLSFSPFLSDFVVTFSEMKKGRRKYNELFAISSFCFLKGED